MSHPLDGARERLKRADEHIQNLNLEITGFLKPAPVIVMPVNIQKGEPIISDENRKAWDELGEFIRTQEVKPRFRVVAGEIIHHLRSAFDHLAWQLSSAKIQTQSPASIEFPVFAKPPDRCGIKNIKKHKMCRYCGKIQGIASPTALARIDSLQPHHRSNPLGDPLWLIHDMDRIDKHRELLMAVYHMRVDISGSTTATGVGIVMPWENRPRIRGVIGPPKVEMNVKMSANITLGEIRGPKDEPIIPTLNSLLSFARDRIESFSGEFV